MHLKVMAAALTADLSLAASAQATLMESVYHNLPTTAYTPTDASILAAQANVAAASPNYSFMNTATTFNYTSTNHQTNTYFAADAAGAALTDIATFDNSAFDATGMLNITVAGNYTFTIANADDAARVYLSSVLVAEQNYGASGLTTPSSTVRSLAVGSYGFEFFYYQQTGRANLLFAVTGAGAVTYSIPEPSSTALFAAVVTAVAGMTSRYRHQG